MAAAYPMDETHKINFAVYELSFETYRRRHQHSSFWRLLSIQSNSFQTTKTVHSGFIKLLAAALKVCLGRAAV